MFLCGCTEKTEYGYCVGVLGQSRRLDPKLEYRISMWNVALGIIFSEFLLPPTIVVLDELYCPIGKKNE